MFLFRHFPTQPFNYPLRNKILGGSNSRYSITVTCTNPGNTVILYSADGLLLASCFAVLAGAGTLVLPYRDYGDLIRGEIWASATVLGIDIPFTEIYYQS